MLVVPLERFTEQAVEELELKDNDPSEDESGEVVTVRFTELPYLPELFPKIANVREARLRVKVPDEYAIAVYESEFVIDAALGKIE